MMKMKLKALSRKHLFIYLFATCLFIICESRGLIFTNKIGNLWIYLGFISCDIAYFYFLAFYFLRWLNENLKYWGLKVFGAVLLIILYSIFLVRLNILFNQLLNQSKTYVPTRDDYSFSFWRSIYIFTYGLIHWYISFSRAKEKELEQERKMKVAAERRALQQENLHLWAQLDAHNWNTALTELYMRSAKQDPDLMLGYDCLIKLTAYSLQTGNANGMAEVSEDITALENYIALLSWSNREKEKHYRLIVKGNSPKGRFIPAKLMTPFIENFFKYGDLSDPQNPGEIHVEYTDHQLYFHCRNPKHKNNEIKGGNGIGIVNTRKRLNIFFAQKHSLEIRNVDREFSVKLIITL
ncbi:hypothetical protein A9970_02155 [Sphingobacterium sp. UME9]|nr:hypothetical protein [Sphingobacterium sp. UME9]